MSEPAFKTLDVADVTDRTKIATFVRPEIGSDLLTITIPGGVLHLHARTLKTIADVMVDQD